MSDEQLLTFPCSFPIKVMGRDEPGFRDVAVGLVEQHAGPIDDANVRTAPSSKGNFISVTVTITATSQQQLDAIYEDLTSHEQIMVAL